MKIDKNTNPFLTALCAPLFMLMGAVAVLNHDLLIIFLFFSLCLGMLGAYVTEFPLLPGLYLNELAHKTALSALFSMMAAFFLFLGIYALSGKGDAGESSAFSTHNFMAVWVGLAIPSYLIMIFFVTRLNKRDLEAEQAIREEKKKKKGSSGGGPPILDKDGF